MNVESTPSPPAPVEPGRRSLLVTLGIFAGITLAVFVSSKLYGASLASQDADREALERARAAESEQSAERSQRDAQDQARADSEVVAFLGILADGRPFADNAWRIAQVEPISRGGIPLTLRSSDDELIKVELLRRDEAAPPAPGQTRHLSIYLRNDGEGQAQTPEAAVRGIEALAQILSERERDYPPPALSAMHER